MGRAFLQPRPGSRTRPRAPALEPGRWGGAEEPSVTLIGSSLWVGRALPPPSGGRGGGASARAERAPVMGKPARRAGTADRTPIGERRRRVGGSAARIGGRRRVGPL